MYMKPFEQRVPDTQYRRVLKQVLMNGVRTVSRQGTDCLTLMVPTPMHFQFENGFPMITERNLAPASAKIPQWSQAIGEICCFLNGGTTIDELEQFGCYWWKNFVTPEKCAKRGLLPGELGPGSYGAAFHDFPTTEGVGFNQFAEVIEEIRSSPNLRTHFISPWIPQYIPRRPGKRQQVVIAPCHGWVMIRILGNKFTLIMVQRSCDLVLGVPNNTLQYAALTMMLAHVTGFEAHEFIHVLLDAHIYVDHIDAVGRMVDKREPRAFPTMKMDFTVSNLFDFRREHFELSDYNPHPGIKDLPVAI